MNLTEIRKAILQNRGGLENATDSQIMMIWNSLDEETRSKYLPGLSEAARKTAEMPLSIAQDGQTNLEE